MARSASTPRAAGSVTELFRGACIQLRFDQLYTLFGNDRFKFALTFCNVSPQPRKTLFRFFDPAGTLPFGRFESGGPTDVFSPGDRMRLGNCGRGQNPDRTERKPWNGCLRPAKGEELSIDARSRLTNEFVYKGVTWFRRKSGPLCVFPTRWTPL